MAQLTYLQLINKVLRKLREDQVGTINYTEYTSLIGEFINDAKREVEDAWDWQALRTPVTFSSIISTASYDQTGTNERSRLIYDDCNRPMAFDITAGTEMQLYDLDTNYVDAQRAMQAVTANTQPTHFSITNDGSIQTVTFLETPEQVRNYKFYWTVPQDDLDDAADVLTIPWKPVVNLATLYALDERGEEIGEPGSKAWTRYNTSLADAIALDSRNRDVIWKIV